MGGLPSGSPPAIVVVVTRVASLTSSATTSAVAREMSSLATCEAPEVGVGGPLGQTAVVAAASDSRLCPRASDALAAHHATVHFADGLFGVGAVFVDGEGETWRVARQPHF